MMPRMLRAAVLLVILSNSLLAWRVMDNRAAAEATVTLTENELPLVSGDSQNTAYAVRLGWESPPGGALSPETAEALRFPADVVQALRSGTPLPRGVMPRRAWAVLEFGDPAQATTGSALRLIDAGADAAALAARHPDRSRQVVVQAEVGAVVVRTEGAAPGTTRLSLRVASIVPDVIAVPRELRHVFEGLPPVTGPHAPRYRATIRYGRHHEPWMVAASRVR